MTIKQFASTLAAVLFLPLLALGAAACGGVQGLATDVTEADGVASDYSVSCTGTTTDGKEVALEGDTSNPPFVGKVDGEEVFSRDCLGDETC